MTPEELAVVNQQIADLTTVKLHGKTLWFLNIDINTPDPNAVNLGEAKLSYRYIECDEHGVAVPQVGPAKSMSIGGLLRRAGEPLTPEQKAAMVAALDGATEGQRLAMVYVAILAFAKADFAAATITK